jgi:hypothetical protein
VDHLKYKVKREKSIGEQRNRRTIYCIDYNSRRRIRPMAIVPIFYEISSNKRKIFLYIGIIF